MHAEACEGGEEAEAHVLADAGVGHVIFVGGEEGGEVGADDVEFFAKAGHVEADTSGKVVSDRKRKEVRVTEK